MINRIQRKDLRMPMSHIIQISDQAYLVLTQLAAENQQSPETAIESLIALAHPAGPIYATEDWYRHLGMTDEDIEKIKALAMEDESADAQ